jgi:hypothetical protein
VGSGAHERRVGRQAGVAQRGLVAAAAVRAGVEAVGVVLDVAHEPDPGVAELEQVLGGEPPAGLVVDVDAGQVVARAVDEDDRHGAGAEALG